VIVSVDRFRTVEFIHDKGYKREVRRCYIHLAPEDFVLTVIFLNVPGIAVGDENILNVFAQ
jgi:hypothetical protein